MKMNSTLYNEITRQQRDGPEPDPDLPKPALSQALKFNHNLFSVPPPLQNSSSSPQCRVRILNFLAMVASIVFLKFLNKIIAILSPVPLFHAQFFLCVSVWLGVNFIYIFDGILLICSHFLFLFFLINGLFCCPDESAREGVRLGLTGTPLGG